MNLSKNDFGIHHAQKVTGRHRSVMETASSVLVSCLGSDGSDGAWS